MTKEILIPHKTSTYIEELFYKYNASCSLIDFLSKQNNPNKELLDEYRKENYEIYISLEIAKHETDSTYRPKELKTKANFYIFDFDKEAIIYDYD